MWFKQVKKKFKIIREFHLNCKFLDLLDSYNSDTDPDYEPAEDDDSNYESSSNAKSSVIKTDEEVMVNKKGYNKKTKKQHNEDKLGVAKDAEIGDTDLQAAKKPKITNGKNYASKPVDEQKAKTAKKA